MGGVRVATLTEKEKAKLLDTQEGHFVDFKSIDIRPAKLTETLSAFSNADGGELYVGIDEVKDGTSRLRVWRGFHSQEAANGHLQAFEQIFSLETDYSYEFLSTRSEKTLVLKIEVRKSRSIVSATSGAYYVRRGAQNLPLRTPEQIEQLKRNKGITSFEIQPVQADVRFITNSEAIIEFMLEVVPHSEPENWLRKQRLVVGEFPTVAGVVLFADEPQAILPKRCGIKIYRYKTAAEQGSRETLAFDPISVEGCAYHQIRAAVNKTIEIMESIRVRTAKGLETVKYPRVAIHEVITNAVLHRDYAIADDIHIRIFDNRIEVLSPGTLPGHITPQNILDERFARNGTLVRLINKYPDPPNKDIGEGLNTAFRAMREMKLKDPIISEEQSHVKVILRHEPLGTPEELILEYLATHESIANRQAREICYIGSENKMKRILQRMVKSGLIEQVPGTTRYNAAYRLREVNDTKKEGTAMV